MAGLLAAVASAIGALLVALMILGLRALWSLATQLASLRSATDQNTIAIGELSRRMDRVDRRPPPRASRGRPQ